MKGNELTREVAESGKVSRAAAKDQVEEVVHEILEALRKGRAVKLPGLGKLVPKSR